MVVLPDCIGIKTDFELKFFFGLKSSLGHIDLVNAIFFYLVVFQVPINIFFINITDGNCDEFWVASIWLCDDLSFKIYY